jgi:methionine biosynthesis protein MetW
MNVPPQSLRVPLRPDLQLIADMVPKNARVLDVGCGDGALLSYLSEERGVDGRGIELSQAGVNACVARGLAVIQGDADTDLSDYPSDAFDEVILSQTIQATRNPKAVLENLLRIGRRVTVSFPNFGHWEVRLNLLFGGRMPRTRALDESWYSTANIHLCTIQDFLDLAQALGAKVERGIAVDRAGRAHDVSTRMIFANLFGVAAVFRLSRS